VRQSPEKRGNHRRDHPHPPNRAGYDANLLIDQISFTAHSLRATNENRYSNHSPRVGNFDEHTWGFFDERHQQGFTKACMTCSRPFHRITSRPEGVLRTTI
jgi:hypothetical protein